MKQVFITFFPHATTFDNEAGISTGSVEVDLSPLGKEQVQNLKDAIKEKMFDVVFSSDLSRAKETAEGALGYKHQIILDKRLREINIGDMTRELDSSTGPLAYKYITTPFPNGESYKDIENKVRDFLVDISNTYPDKRIAIFAHQGPQLALEVITRNISWEEAMKRDWRNTGAFQYGWEYVFNS
jgi:broad specificity phosphatase PhoE